MHRSPHMIVTKQGVVQPIMVFLVIFQSETLISPTAHLKILPREHVLQSKFAKHFSHSISLDSSRTMRESVVQSHGIKTPWRHPRRNQIIVDLDGNSRDFHQLNDYHSNIIVEECHHCIAYYHYIIIYRIIHHF